MNKNKLNHLYFLHVLIPPDPLLLQAKEGGVQRFAPHCEAERGGGEFMLLNKIIPGCIYPELTFQFIVRIRIFSLYFGERFKISETEDV
jgi:hypothetical protein